MGKLVLKDAFVEVDAEEISDHVSSVTIETARDEVDVTAMGASNKETVAGLGDATITLEVYQDFAAGEVDQIMWPLSTTDTAFVVKVRPVNADASATNPQYKMTSLLFGYSPIAGAIGEAATTSLVFKNASQAGLTRGIQNSS